MAKRKRPVILEAGSDDEASAAAVSDIAVTTTTDSSFIVPPGARAQDQRVLVTQSLDKRDPSERQAGDEEEPFYATTWALHAQGNAGSHPEVLNGPQSTSAPASPASSPPPASKKARQKTNKNVRTVLLFAC